MLSRNNVTHSSGPFQLLPAIDIRAGRVVRLELGDFDHETVFSSDPVSVARGFIDGGARGLHVVDLDGARGGTRVNAEAVRDIVLTAGSGVAVEVAGGLRSSESIVTVLAQGAARVVVGTRALSDPGFVGALVEEHGPERVAVSIDVRDGLAVGHGWVSGSVAVPVAAAMASLLAVGVTWFEVTAISRDGMLCGPDLELLTSTARDPRAQIIAAGGIATTEHLRAVRAVGCRGAIVGRALYDGTLSLADALRAID